MARPCRHPVPCATGADAAAAELHRDLTDVSQRLFQALAPTGELVIGNVAANNPSRWIMEFFADWCLIHRTPEELAEFGVKLNGTTSWVDAEPSGINLFLHAVKEL